MGMHWKMASKKQGSHINLRRKKKWKYCAWKLPETHWNTSKL